MLMQCHDFALTVIRRFAIKCLMGVDISLSQENISLVLIGDTYYVGL